MKTPKAPPYIDKWMIDPPVSNLTESPIIARHLQLLIRELAVEQPWEELLAASNSSIWTRSDYLSYGITISSVFLLLLAVTLRSTMLWRVYSCLFLPFYCVEILLESCVGVYAASIFIAMCH